MVQKIVKPENVIKMIKCKHCSESFPKVGQLSGHMWKKHPEEIKHKRKEKVFIAFKWCPKCNADLVSMTEAIAKVDGKSSQKTHVKFDNCPKCNAPLRAYSEAFAKINKTRR